MDITNLVRAKRQCGFSAWVGYIIGSFLIVFALGIPWLFLLVAAFLIASYSTTKGNRVGAALHAALVAVPLAFLILDEPAEPAFLFPTQVFAFLFFMGFLLSLFGLRAAFTHHKLFPPYSGNKDTMNIAKWTSQKLAFLSSGKKRTIAFSYVLAMVCLLPIIVPTMIGIIYDFKNMAMWLKGSGVPFWLVLGGYAFLVGPCVFGAYYFHARAKRVAAVSLQEAKERDQRPPILLLRSFQDDLTPIARKLPFTTYQPSDFYFRAWTLEEMVEKTLRGYGPVIAIGRPGEKLPPAGAAREYVSNEEWQDRVKDFLSQALLVVVIAGKTSGLDWEYQQLAKLKVWNRLVILFPPVDEEELQMRWSHFQQTTAGRPWCEKQDEVSKALLATFDKDGAPRFVTCKWRDDEECYRLAIHCGLTASS